MWKVSREISAEENPILLSWVLFRFLEVARRNPVCWVECKVKGLCISCHARVMAFLVYLMVDSRIMPRGESYMWEDASGKSSLLAVILFAWGSCTNNGALLEVFNYSTLWLNLPQVSSRKLKTVMEGATWTYWGRTFSRSQHLQHTNPQQPISTNMKFYFTSTSPVKTDTFKYQ